MSFAGRTRCALLAPWCLFSEGRFQGHTPSSTPPPCVRPCPQGPCPPHCISLSQAPKCWSSSCRPGILSVQLGLCGEAFYSSSEALLCRSPANTPPPPSHLTHNHRTLSSNNIFSPTYLTSHLRQTCKSRYVSFNPCRIQRRRPYSAKKETPKKVYLKLLLSSIYIRSPFMYPYFSSKRQQDTSTLQPDQLRLGASRAIGPFMACPLVDDLASHDAGCMRSGMRDIAWFFFLLTQTIESRARQPKTPPPSLAPRLSILPDCL